MLLEIDHLNVRYEKAVLINDLSMGVDTGELVSLVGPNGAGKSTSLRAITGLVAWEREIKRRSTAGEIHIEGKVTFDGQRIDHVPAHEIVRMGLVLCPERRRPFREMTVLENLMAGAYLQKDKKKNQDTLSKVYDLFPVLKERSKQISGTLSGGEQQMLAIGRAFMSDPKLLCIDEPSTGLAPKTRAEVFEKILQINRLGITILLVEQEVSTVFKMTKRNYVLSSGKIIAQGTGEELMEDEIIRKTYLGL
ncbi:MAG: branched-chain amino acid ABC transporter ATP-binding protein [Deltaproteobacteria bacterium RBG_13_43_22]|nr:MAG: branched-chain amino acid ABC transporter ATP-binding protein [Deltaproteobacteria bacterium RBG_13_43_22]